MLKSSFKRSIWSTLTIVPKSNIINENILLRIQWKTHLKLFKIMRRKLKMIHTLKSKFFSRYFHVVDILLKMIRICSTFIDIVRLWQWKGNASKERKNAMYSDYLLPLLFRHILMVFNNACHIKLVGWLLHVFDADIWSMPKYKLVSLSIGLQRVFAPFSNRWIWFWEHFTFTCLFGWRPRTSHENWIHLQNTELHV